MKERNDPYAGHGEDAPQVRKYKFAAEKLNKEFPVVDLGCGLGYGVKILSNAGFVVVGVDYSAEALKTAYTRYSGLYILHDLNNMSIYGFKSAVCLETICHLDNPQKFVDSLTVDELVISAPIDPNPNDGYIYRKHNLSEQQFKDLFKEWDIVDELELNYGTKYLTIYLTRKEN
jgi:SAM-dependent methyltransferase